MSNVSYITLAAFALTALLVGCKEKEVRFQPADPTEQESAVALKSYDVPSGHAQQVSSVLRSVFRDQEITARAELSPDGQLLVLGPDGVQQGVDELLAKMQDRKPPPAPPAIELNYWLVLGTPAAEHTVGTGLDEVKAALDSVSAAQGPMRFVKLERLRVQSLADEHANAGGIFAKIRQRASLNNDKVLADVGIEVGPGARMDTRLSIEPGKLLVLGEAGINMSVFRPSPVDGEEGPFTLFYVVRAEVTDAG
jgi:hypothetical protein